MLCGGHDVHTVAPDTEYVPATHSTMPPPLLAKPAFAKQSVSALDAEGLLLFAEQALQEVAFAPENVPDGQRSCPLPSGRARWPGKAGAHDTAPATE